MITSLLSLIVHPRRAAAHVTALVGLAGLAAVSSAQAFVPSVIPDTVVTADTFTFEVEGYNATTPSGNYYATTQTLIGAFGTTQTFANAAANGQTVTLTSGETKSGNTFTDTITISVPTGFIPAGTKDSNGNTTDSLEFSIGNYNIPTGSTGDPLDFTTAITGTTTTGSVTYSGGTLAIASTGENPVLTNGNKSYSDLESVTAGTNNDIGALNVRSFTIALTYSAVPEPSTYATVLLGAAGLCWLTVARRRARA